MLLLFILVVHVLLLLFLESFGISTTQFESRCSKFKVHYYIVRISRNVVLQKKKLFWPPGRVWHEVGDVKLSTNIFVGPFQSRKTRKDVPIWNVTTDVFPAVRNFNFPKDGRSRESMIATTGIAFVWRG